MQAMQSLTMKLELKLNLIQVELCKVAEKNHYVEINSKTYHLSFALFQFSSAILTEILEANKIH